MQAVLFSGPGYRACEIGEADIADVQRFFEANPEYFLRVGAQPPEADEARKEFDDRPPEGWSWRNRWFIRFLDGAGSIIGVADVVSDLVAEGVWHVGLFVVATRMHGTGTAQDLYGGLEAWMRRGGARWLRLGVVESNAQAGRFWEKAGYAQVRTREGVEIGRQVNTLRIMTRPLADGRMAEYLRIVARDRPDAP